MTRATLLAVPLLLFACTSDPSSNRGVAERFLDAHYVKIDLVAAGELASGLAGEKIAQERRLVGTEAIDEATRKPSVHYRFLEERPDGDDRSRLVYRATFSIAGGDSFDRRILLVMHREPNGWRIVNFEEFE